jgi:hypothetical protein
MTGAAHRQPDEPPADEPRADEPRSVVTTRLAALLPPAILVVGFGVLAATNWSAVSSAAGSAQAWLVIAAIVIGWVGLGFVLRRFVANPWVRSGVMSAFAVVLVALHVVPYFRDEKVVEQFPGVASGRVANDTADVPDAVPVPPAAPAPPASSTAEPVPVPAESAAAEVAEAPPVPPAEPVRISAGSLSGLGHSASGTAALYRQPDGTFVVGLEGIDIQPGPDYFVYVVPGAGRQDPDGGTDLGALRGNQGTQFYAVPAGVDPTGWTVLVWCRAFAVPVAHATPA